MPGLLIWAIIFAIIAAAAETGAHYTKKSAGPPPGRLSQDAEGALVTLQVIMMLFTVGTVLAVFFCSVNQVGTREVGIVTSFGKPVGHVSTGFNLVAPWDQVTPMDEAVQKTDYNLNVTIAGHQTAQLPVKLRWRLNSSNADDAFGNYKNSTTGLLTGLVTPEIEKAANTVFEAYDPVASVTTTAAIGSRENPSIAQLGTQVQNLLQRYTGGDITIVSLTVLPPVYSSTVQNRINSVVTQRADTLIAQESVQTALQQAQANKDLSSSVSNDPLVLVANCFTYLTSLAKDGLTPPAGFSCWPGQGSGIVIPAAPAGSGKK